MSSYSFRVKWDLKPYTETIAKLQTRQQISAYVAMGTKMGPSYANLFVGHVEQQIFEQYTGPIPDFCGRYIDDV